MHITDMLTFLGNGLALIGALAKILYDLIINRFIFNKQCGTSTDKEVLLAAKRKFNERANWATFVAFVVLAAGSVVSMLAVVH